MQCPLSECQTTAGCKHIGPQGQQCWFGDPDDADPDVWRGERMDPARLADEIAAARTQVLRIPPAGALLIVNISCSAENRDLIVDALRQFVSRQQ